MYSSLICSTQYRYNLINFFNQLQSINNSRVILLYLLARSTDAFIH